jgi:hypothetical protein
MRKPNCPGIGIPVRTHGCNIGWRQAKGGQSLCEGCLQMIPGRSKERHRKECEELKKRNALLRQTQG